MNETRLSWDPWQNDGLAHYEVLMRRTHEYTWTRTAAVGRKTDVTVPESKDDFVFAVRAVARSGHKGLPVFQSVARRRRR